MYSRQAKNEIIASLVETPFIYRVCKKFGVSRSTFYKWIKDDEKFSKEVVKALREGKRSLNELAITSLVKKVSEGHFPAIRYYLQHNHGDYRIPEKINSLSVALARMKPKTEKKPPEPWNPESKWSDGLTTKQEEMFDLLERQRLNDTISREALNQFITGITSGEFKTVAEAEEFLQFVLAQEQEESPPSG